jgi:hypothetical protein
MLSFRDFFHLPQLDPFVDRMLAEPAGLLVVAGLDPRPGIALGTGKGFLPSGRLALFGTLMDEILARSGTKKCIVLSRDKATVRVQRAFRRRVKLELFEGSLSHAEWIAGAAARHPGLLVIDKLDADTAGSAFEAARKGLVLSQLDTVFRGGSVHRQLLELAGIQEDPGTALWVLTVHRLPALCPACRVAVQPDPAEVERLRGFPGFGESADEANVFQRSSGCVRCGGSGRYGDVAAFDVFRTERREDGSVEP